MASDEETPMDGEWAVKRRKRQPPASESFKALVDKFHSATRNDKPPGPAVSSVMDVDANKLMASMIQMIPERARQWLAEQLTFERTPDPHRIARIRSVLVREGPRPSGEREAPKPPAPRTAHAGKEGMENPMNWEMGPKGPVYKGE